MIRMNPAHAVWFFRPACIVCVCYLTALLACMAIARYGRDDVGGPISNDTTSSGISNDEVVTQLEQLADDLSRLNRPSPTLLPEQVVKLQIEALREDDRRFGTLQCMAFASPDNLAVTGPVDKFSRVVRGSTFTPLSQSHPYMIGKPVVAENQARLFVTFFAQNRPWAFVWVLSKQSEGRHQGCWLTDVVFPVRDANSMSDNEV